MSFEFKFLYKALIFKKNLQEITLKKNSYNNFITRLKKKCPMKPEAPNAEV